MEDRRGVGEAVRLLRGKGVPFNTDVSLKNHTTMRVGGEVPLWIEPRNEEETAFALRVLAEAFGSAKPLVLGRGSNLLPCDRGLSRGVVFTGGMSGIERLDGGRVRVTGGTTFSQVLSFCVSEGLSGLEPLSGIPATVGGMVVMNAGSFGRSIGELIESIRLIKFSGEGRVFGVSEVDWGYRFSSLKGKGVVTQVVLRLADAKRGSVRAEVARFMRQRAEKQPLGMPSSGSVFKNPPGFSAGRLIEDAGLKGRRMGGAQVSEKHANFIVNRGEARCRDVLGLMELVKREVSERFGVTLEEEVEYVC